MIVDTREVRNVSQYARMLEFVCTVMQLCGGFEPDVLLQALQRSVRPAQLSPALVLSRSGACLHPGGLRHSAACHLTCIHAPAPSALFSRATPPPRTFNSCCATLPHPAAVTPNTVTMERVDLK